jgi:hypothetical protein
MQIEEFKINPIEKNIGTRPKMFQLNSPNRNPSLRENVFESETSPFFIISALSPPEKRRIFDFEL